MEREARKETRETGVQTSSLGVVVEMAMEEYMEWRAYKTMKYYNVGLFAGLNAAGNFLP